MSQPRVPPGLEHFSRLNTSTWYHQPPFTSSPSKVPDCILLLGWMDAQPRHIAKYTSAYSRLYTSSRILAITTSFQDAVFTSTAGNIQRIEPALEVLYGLPADAKVLLHFFSNGGGYTAMLLAETFRKKMGRAMPVAASVFDSTPGKTKWPGQVRAFAHSLPKNMFLRTIGTLLLHLSYPLLQISYLVTGTDFVESIRQTLNDKNLIGIEAPRVYIYSVKDDMVDWVDVEEHADEAEGRGYTVAREKFLDSSHAGHMVQDPLRYWGIVERLWNLV